MRLYKTLTMTVAMLLVFSVVALAGEKKQDAEKEAPVELKNQTLCPVMGGKIDSTAYTDIQGQRVYHCCPGCSSALKKDPDKFFKKAAEEGVLFENIQTTCPVSGEQLKEETAFIDFEGRRIYFCCAGCEAPFNKEPQKYLSMLDAPAAKMDGHKMKTGHEGHNH